MMHQAALHESSHRPKMHVWQWRTRNLKLADFWMESGLQTETKASLKILQDFSSQAFKEISRYFSLFFLLSIKLTQTKQQMQTERCWIMASSCMIRANWRPMHTPTPPPPSLPACCCVWLISAAADAAGCCTVAQPRSNWGFEDGNVKTTGLLEAS